MKDLSQSDPSLCYNKIITLSLRVLCEVQFLMFQEICISLHSYIILLHFSVLFSLYFLFCFPLKNGLKPTPNMGCVYHPMSTPSSSYEQAAGAQTLGERKNA